MILDKLFFGQNDNRIYVGRHFPADGFFTGVVNVCVRFLFRVPLASSVPVFLHISWMTKQVNVK